MDRRLQTPDSGSNYQFQNKMTTASLPRSMFDLSHLHTTTLPDIGSLIPIWVHETVPNDSFELSVNTLLRVLPQVVPMYSRQRLSVHAFWSRSGDLWNEFNTYMTKGYTGDEILSKPVLTAGLNAVAQTEASYLNLPAYFIPALGTHQLNADTYSHLKLNALPFMMYQRIWRDYYMNKNFYINDRVLLPNVDDHFRLNTAGAVISALDAGQTFDLTEMRYRDFADDYFLSAFPSPQRGTAPTLDFSGTLSSIFGSGSATGPFFNVNSSGSAVNVGASAYSMDPIQTGLTFDNMSTTLTRFINSQLLTNLNAALSPTATLTSSITLNQIRELAVAQSELEKMAKTDGSYGDFGLTFFGRVSKNAIDYRPVYVGGTYQAIQFSEVLQTTNTATDPLGSYAGHGISYTSDGYLGRIDCDDYGYLMLVASVVPDTYYSQGLDRMWFKSLQSDEFLPDRARLGMREILNKELLFSGVAETDNDIFAYQSPFDELRYVPNRISGKIANPNELSFFPYTQSRFFTSTPTFSQSFATMKDNVRMDFLAAPTEVPYTAQFSISCRAVRPLPYHPIPSNLGV
ncbi:major capsid protein [Tortoise microvirus 80]|nr:major capsid protein [Tortoise microvirus 80]